MVAFVRIRWSGTPEYAGRTNAKYVRGLIELHNEGKLDLAVCAVSGSENQMGGGVISIFAEFTDRLSSLGLDHLTILKPIGYVDMAFVDYFIIGNEQMFNRASRIHEILFPTMTTDYAEYKSSRGVPRDQIEMDRKWRNAKCDVLMLWCHLHYSRDLFVTSDGRFHKQSVQKELIDEFGTVRIRNPLSAWRGLSNSL